MRRDCNLVLYDNGYKIWSMRTGGFARNCICFMQTDGNLVIYDTYERPIWATYSARGEGQYALILRKYRDLVIYGLPLRQRSEIRSDFIFFPSSSSSFLKEGSDLTSFLYCKRRSLDMAAMHQDTSEDCEVVGEKLNEIFGIVDSTPMMTEVVAEVCDIVVERGGSSSWSWHSCYFEEARKN